LVPYSEGTEVSESSVGSAGNRGRRKRRPLCSGVDTGYVSKIDNIAGLRKQADFLLVFHTRKLD
jgi:hypothetical protein